MSEGEFKKRILEHGKNYGYRDFRDATISWLDEARKDIVAHALPYCQWKEEYMRTDSRLDDENTPLVPLKDVLKWFGAEKK